MKKIAHMVIGGGCALIGVFMIFGSFSIPSMNFAQNLPWNIGHLIIWLCFLMGIIGFTLLAIGICVVAKATR